MEQEKPRASKPRKNNRVSLTPESKQKLDDWKRQVADRFMGIKISEADLVNWKISTAPELLCAKDTQEIGIQFFDEIRQLEWVIERAKDARKNGLPFEFPKWVSKTKKPREKPEEEPCPS